MVEFDKLLTRLEESKSLNELDLKELVEKIREKGSTNERVLNLLLKALESEKDQMVQYRILDIIKENIYYTQIKK